MVSDLLLSTTALARRILPAALRCDRRGATAVLFAVSAMTFFGLVGLGTEAGSWYVARRNAQNAADAAARAGALGLALSTPANRNTQVSTTAKTIASENGFPENARTTVTVNRPPASGTHTSNQSAVEVRITQTQPMYFSALFLTAAPQVATRAVAVLAGTSNACILGLVGGLAMGGNSFTSGPECVLASNNAGSSSINVYGSADVVAYTLMSVGRCSGCNQGSVQLTKPYAEYQLPVSNPYEMLDSKTYNTTCLGSPPQSGTINPTGLTHAYCSSISLSGHPTLDFKPGTYIFKNSSIDIQSGTVTCNDCTGSQGVTIIFTGDPANIGGIKINANASVRLKAPGTNPDDPDYNGVLFFRDPRATSNSTSNPAVSINGGAGTNLFGAMYFPTSYIRFNGNESNTPSTCTAIIGGTMDFSGSADTYVDVSGCEAYGTAVPKARVVRLVE